MMAKLVRKGEQQAKDLEALQGQGVVIRAAGEDITVKPFTFGKLLKALKYLSNLGTAISEKMDDIAILRAFATNGDDVIGLMMLSTGKDKQFFDDLDAGEGVDLALATWNVNSDFFAQTIAPKMKALAESQGLQSDQETSPQV
jgi:hypothetical protein